MKKFYLFTLLLGSFLSFAQSNVQTTIDRTETNWTTTLQYLNIAEVTSGVLYDKVTSFSNLIDYNTANYNVADNSTFRQAISELYRASDQTRFVPPSALDQPILMQPTILASPGNPPINAIPVIDVGIINTSLQKLNYNEDAPSNGGLTYSNGVLYPIAGKPSFLTKKVLMISPLKDFVSGTSVTFRFSSDLIFSNATSPIKTLTADFGNNQVFTIIQNGNIIKPTVNISYSAKDMKSIKFNAVFMDNTILETYGMLYVETRTIAEKNASCTEPLREKDVHISTIPFQGYEESSPVFGKIEYNIFYNYQNTQKKILKPIIIIDGFDPGDARKVLDCDCEIDPKCFLDNSDLNITYFPLNITLTFNPAKHRSIEDMMFYLVGGQPVNLIDKLRNEGYDVIIVNNPTYSTTNVAGFGVTIDGGADYIERNAMNLVSYIQSLKNELAANNSAENLVIIGPSMGGQIARYALAYMDKKYAETNDDEWKHHTRLWVSVDSPHLGANIPLSTQASIYWLGYITGNDEAKDKYNKMLNSVAGRQQLIYQYNQFESNSGFNSLFDTYYQNLSNNGLSTSAGYPLSTSSFRKIAMLNGSVTGANTRYGQTTAYDNQTFMYLRGYVDLSWWFIHWSVTFFRNENKFLPAFGKNGKIFHGYQSFNSTYNVYANNNDYRGNMDILPGGLYDSQNELKDAIVDGLSKKNLRKDLRDFFPVHSFISTFSAVGHLQPNQNWGNRLNFNLTCTSNKLTSFDSYFASKYNTEHTSFTEESVNWLMKELGDSNNPPLPQAPWFPLDGYTIIGDDAVCTNSTKEYSLGNICNFPSEVEEWSLSNGNAKIISTTGSSVYLQGVNNGNVTLKATFQNGQTLTKIIWIGMPSLTVEAEENNTNFVTFYVNSGIPNVSLADMGVPPSNVTWKRLDTGQIRTGYTYTAHQPGYNWSFDVEVKATNSCGTITTYATISPPPPPLDCITYKLTRRENTDDYLLIMRSEPPCPTYPNGSGRQGEEYQITVANSMGTIVISKTGDGFDLGGFPTGMYVVNIQKDSQVVINQTVIKN